MNKESVKAFYSEPANVREYYNSELDSLKWNGNGQGISLCPFHNDGKESLSVKDSGAYFCHACNSKGGDIISFHMARHGVDFQSALSQLAGKAGIPESKKIIKTYDYTDSSGKLIFQSCRYEPKGFTQRRPDPIKQGNWIWNLKDIQLTPYNLPAVIKSKYCFIVEGEKDVESLKIFGFIASCNAGGAGKWKPEYNGYFKGKSVYILPDNDKPGRDHALQVAGSLKGIASSIKVIELPGLKEKGDVSDYLQARQTEEKTVETIKAELRAIVKAASEWTAPEATAPAEGKSLLSSLIKWNDVESLSTSTEYLLDRLIPEGAITLLFGRGGIGKTSLTLQIVHAIAEGKDFAGLKAKQTPVTYIDLENPLSVLKDRIKHIGQSGNILIWHGSCEPSPARLDRAEYIQYLDLPKGLIVFDTLRASFLGDENNSRDIAIIIDRLKQLRDKGFTILLLHHTPKSNDAVYKGSTAILDLVDHALCLEPIKQSEDEEIDFDPERIYKFGVKIKTRFEPFSMHLQFDPAIKGFCVAKDPATEIIDAISGLLQEKGELTTNQLFEFAKQELNLKSKGQVLKLLKKGEGISWEVETKGRAKYYRVQSPDHRARLWTIGQSISPEANEPEKAQTLTSPIESYSPEGIQTIGLYDKSSVQGNMKNSHSPDRCIDREFAEILP